MEEDIKILEEFCKHGGYKSNGLPVAFIEIPYTALKQAIEHLIARNKELEEENIKLHTEIAEVVYWESSSVEQIKEDYIPKSKVKELAKKYEFAINGYDSSTADYKHSQNLGKYLACIELLED